MGDKVIEHSENCSSIGTQRIIVNTEKLVPGIYFIRLIGENINITKKLIIE